MAVEVPGNYVKYKDAKSIGSHMVSEVPGNHAKSNGQKTLVFI